MARRRGSNDSTGSCIVYMLMFVFFVSVAGAISSLIVKNGAIVIFVLIAIFVIMFYIAKKHEKMQKELLEEQRLYEETKKEWYKKQEIINKQRRELLKTILSELHLENFNLLLKRYDAQITVKSAQSLDNYSDYKYIRENDALERISETLEEKKEIADSLNSFLEENSYKTEPQYDYVEKQLINYANAPITYNVKVVYITPAVITEVKKNLVLQSHELPK